MITDAKPRVESSLLGYAEARRNDNRGAKEEDEVKLAWAMPWRGLTEQREERLRLFRLSRVMTEGDKSQNALLRML